ncbi:C40 family peptidase [Streptomyces jumonjinensis]|uniref:Glycoside hydrolase n=1 Tax=Streptomyces jumonjinensis TaxID=1945 RepID=A0A646KSK4_STRJU|nr:bifunctional lytic transglycosylase/C40 family peptidase [Streptomyces jumonjinensis]MQT05068.1 glycoside hydrolase [Streptomyces jumonjinensis]
MKKAVIGGLALIFALALSTVTLLTTFGGGSSASAQAVGPGGGLSADAPVPEWVRVLVNKHAGKCPQVTASLLAAQLFAESGFNPKAVSPVGAQGIAQFMPATWAAYGMDGDNDGDKDPFDPVDAIPAQANYDCVLAGEVRNVPGDSTDNMLAAYNAGGGAVIRYGGIPPYAETRSYVKRIRDLTAKWADLSVPNLPGGKGAARAISAAKTALGTWYQWGGQCVPPYQAMGGCDCSSLTQMAWSAAGVNLPRVTYGQVHSGTPVKSVAQLRPGDLIFTRPGPAGPEHVAMYLGDSQVIDAPRTGKRVQITPLSQWTADIIAIRHIG